MTAKQKQCLLTYLGYYTGPIDGIWGDKSRQATEAFQRDYQLTVDGVFRGATVQRIREVIASGEEPKQESVNVDTASPDWWKDIRYFTREECKCKCGGRYCNGYPAEMKESVMRIADAARKHFNAPADVISALRCQRHNANEGGVVNSQHMYGEAMDIRIRGVSSEALYRFIISQPGVRYAYKINDTNVHFDIPKGSR